MLKSKLLVSTKLIFRARAENCYAIGASIITKISNFCNTIAIPGLTLENESKLKTILSILEDIKINSAKQPITIAITDFGNSIFPGKIRGKCYLYRQQIPTAMAYAKKFHIFIRKITDILPEARILIIPAIIRRPKKCSAHCNRCIYFINPEIKLKMIYDIHSNYYQSSEQIQVISYEQIITYFCKKQTNISFQSGCPVSYFAKQLLNCAKCENSRNHKADYIHPCCQEAIKNYGTVFQNLFRDFGHQSEINQRL